MSNMSRDMSSKKKMCIPKIEINLQETSNFQKQLDSLSKQLASMQKDLSAMHANIYNTLRPFNQTLNQPNSHPSNLQNVLLS